MLLFCSALVDCYRSRCQTLATVVNTTVIGGVCTGQSSVLRGSESTSVYPSTNIESVAITMTSLSGGEDDSGTSYASILIIIILSGIIVTAIVSLCKNIVCNFNSSINRHFRTFGLYGALSINSAYLLTYFSISSYLFEHSILVSKLSDSLNLSFAVR